MEELPPMFILNAIPNFHQMPPILRRGYPLTDAAFLRLIKDAGYSTIPSAEYSSFLMVVYAAQRLSGASKLANQVEDRYQNVSYLRPATTTT